MGLSDILMKWDCIIYLYRGIHSNSMDWFKQNELTNKMLIITPKYGVSLGITHQHCWETGAMTFKRIPCDPLPFNIYIYTHVFVFFYGVFFIQRHEFIIGPVIFNFPWMIL